MERFEKAFMEAVRGDVLPMDAMLRYASEVPGKRLRPRLVFLSAQLFGAINGSTQRTALFVEMLHTATLIHDDVVDESDMRRGRASLNARWGNQAAVLAGDYLLSKAILQLTDPADSLILKEMLDVALAMSEGELMQNSKSGNYLEIIERKTARLIRSCCVGGAMSVGASQEATNAMGDYGLHLGLIFQMRDDILDNDDPEITALAEQLLPEYKKKALKALDALNPFVKDRQAYSSLKELIEFCAMRTH